MRPPLRLRLGAIGLLAAVGAGAAAQAPVGAPRRSSPPVQHDLLRYDVDLAAPPGKRYAHVWADFLSKRGDGAFALTFKAWSDWLSAALPDLFATPFATHAAQAAWLEMLRKAHPDALEEMNALSKALLNASTGQQPMYELPALAIYTSLYPITNIAPKNGTDTIPKACTSTLVARADGTVLHGRSLDYEPRDPMANATVVLDFHRAGKPSYRCLHPLVYPTAMQWFTCVRPGAFSLSVNARSQGTWTEHNATFRELLERAGRPGKLFLGEVAELAMQAESFDAALGVLAASPVISSNYFVLAGSDGRGAIVTRYGNASSADVWALSPQESADSDGQPPWLRTQTNVDHWVPMATGAYATHRRQRVIELVTGLGQHGLTRDSLMEVYLTDSARPGSENRTQPEDTGVILRPSTIATVILDPAAAKEPEPDPRYWRIWRDSPTIGPPVAPPAAQPEMV